MTPRGVANAGRRPLAPAVRDGEGALDGSAQGYLARSAELFRAALSAEPGAVSDLEVEAGEWRKLAVEADWQEAARAAIAALGPVLVRREGGAGLAARKAEGR